MARLGVTAIALGAVMFATMALLAKEASARLPGPEVALIRFLVGVAAVGGAMLIGLRLKPNNLGGLFLRGLFGGTAVLFYFVAIAHLAVGMATLLNYTFPIFTAVFAAIFLREGIAPSTGVALLVTFVGVVLVAHGNARPGEFGFGWWEACGLLSSMLSGAAVTTIRFVRRTDGTWEIFGAFCVIGALACLGPAVSTWVTPRPGEWALLVAVGLLSLVAQLLLTWSLRFVTAAAAGVVSQLTPVAALGLGVALLGDVARPLALVGSAITVAAVAWSAVSAGRRREVRRE